MFMGKSTQIINILWYNKYGSDKLKQRRTFYKNFNLEEEKIIKEYIRNQLQEDYIADQIGIEEYIDPFKKEK